MRHIVLFTLLFFVSCNIDKIGKEEQFYFQDKQAECLSEKLDCRFIPLETTEECLLSFIDKLYIDSLRIYLIDGRSHFVYAFEHSGKFITKIGDVGQGPSEYVLPMSIYTDNARQEFVIADANASKLIYYDLNTLRYKRNRAVEPFYECARLSNGDIAWVSGGAYTSPQREKYYLKITDADLNLKQYAIPCAFNPAYRLSAGSYFYTYNHQSYLNLPFSPEVERIDKEESYRVAIEGFEFADEDWLKAHAEKNYMQALRRSEYISAIHIQETDQLVALLFYVGQKDYLGFYDKQTGESLLYSAFDFVRETSLYGLGRTLTTYQNYFVAAIDVLALKEHQTDIKALETIRKQIPADSNPILCLFKFNEL